MSLYNLNSPQLEAVQNVEGPLLVLAGAGTGKTRVLTSRIIHIISSCKASPLQILAVTFTNKAAAEMKNRIGEVIKEQINSLWVGTFHSIAARILRRHPELVGLRSDFTIIDDDDQTRLLKQILTDFNIDSKQFPARSYLNKISRLKDQMLMADDLNAAELKTSLPHLKEIYENYQLRLKAMNAADFGDLLLHNLTIFSNAPEVLLYYQQRFHHILVDEYQDTNNAQYQWLLRLAAIHKNICCVGDDDQSIYSWRGANIANILSFEKDFTDAKIIRLEQNYRSSARILKAADSLISNNKERHGKTLWTDAKQGQKVKLLSFLDDRMEAATIAQMIKNAIADQKFQPQEIAVLVRAGYQTRSFEEAFIQNSLPYKVIGGMKFYERLEIRDSIAYLRICANFADDLALSRIINTPKRGIGNAAISGLYAKSKREKIPLFATIKEAVVKKAIKGDLSGENFLNTKARENLKNLIEQIEKANAQIGRVGLSKIARSLLGEVGYTAMWKNENTLEAQGRLENIEEFINSLDDFSTMVEFLEYVSLIEARDDKKLQNTISVMTVHAAKGLEFDLVFIPGLEEGIFPSAKSIDERNGLEEERRLMYVAITRTKKELVLSYVKSRYIFGDYQMQIPSRFLKELPESEIEAEEIFFAAEFLYNKKSQNNAGSLSAVTKLQKVAAKHIPAKHIPEIAGKRVFHQKFGYGKILNIDGNKLQILFEKAGTKTVMKDFIAFV
jgi:DNA helicase-2/ATP-dependent DNA helicase PcrA